MSDCVLVTTVSPAKTAEPINVPFGLLTQVGSRNYVLYIMTLEDTKCDVHKIPYAVLKQLLWLRVYTLRYKQIDDAAYTMQPVPLTIIKTATTKNNIVVLNLPPTL